MNAMAGPEFRPLPWRYLAWRRHGTGYRIPTHPPLHPKLPSHSFDCPDAVFILAPDLFE